MLWLPRTSPSAVLTKDQTEALQRAYTVGKIRLLGIFLPMGVVLLAAFAHWDYMMSPETAPITISIRFLLSMVLVLMWLHRSSNFMRRWHDWIIGGMLALSGIAVAVVLSLVPGGYAHASGGIAIIIMFGAGAVRLPALHTILASALIVAVTAWLMAYAGETVAMVTSVSLMLVSFASACSKTLRAATMR